LLDSKSQIKAGWFYSRTKRLIIWILAGGDLLVRGIKAAA